MRKYIGEYLKFVYKLDILKNISKTAALYL